MDKFLYPCVSFVSLSLLSLSMLLFEIFDCRFLAFIGWLFTTCVFATLAIIGTTLVCGRFRSRVLISKILTCFFLFQVIQRCDMLYLDYYWISCRELQVGKDFYGGEAD